MQILGIFGLVFGLFLAGKGWYGYKVILGNRIEGVEPIPEDRGVMWVWFLCAVVVAPLSINLIIR